MGEITGGVRKSGVLEHKSGNISETRIKIKEKLVYGGPIAKGFYSKFNLKR